MMGVASLVAFAFSALATWTTRTVLRRRGRLAAPNGRDLHRIPTPRGGGIGFVLPFLVACAVLGLQGGAPSRFAWGLFGATLAIGVVGYIDDQRDVPASVRFLVHGVAAVFFLVWIGGYPVVGVGGAHLAMGWLGAVLGWFWLVWGTNLYNFMDGIDGLAAGNAVFVALALFLVTPDVSFTHLLPLLAAALLGFLLFNWPPASIFMGDVGSGVLGFIVAAYALGLDRIGALPITVPLLMMAPFVVDATATLLWRVVTGQHWTGAHNDHAYQRAVRAGRSHRQVTGVTLAIVAACCALAVVTARTPWSAALATAVAYVLLVALWLRGRRGPV